MDVRRTWQTQPIFEGPFLPGGFFSVNPNQRPTSPPINRGISWPQPSWDGPDEFSLSSPFGEPSLPYTPRIISGSGRYYEITGTSPRGPISGPQADPMWGTPSAPMSPPAGQPPSSSSSRRPSLDYFRRFLPGVPLPVNVPNVQTALSRAGSSFNTLTDLLGSTNLLPTLSSLQSRGPVTVFAPTQQAFAKLERDFPGATDFLTQPDNQDLLRRVLSYHVTQGQPPAFGSRSMNSLGSPDGIRLFNVPFAPTRFYNEGRAVPVAGQKLILNNGSFIVPINEVLIPPDLASVLEENLGMPPVSNNSVWPLYRNL